MAIKEFQIGPINYVEDQYFDRDYTISNIIRCYLDCDNEDVKGGRLNAVIQSSMTVSVGKSVDAVVSAQDYTVESYFDGEYVKAQGSQFSLYLRPIFEVLFEIALTAESNVSSIPIKTTDSTVALNSEFTQNTQASRSQDIDMFAFSDAAIAVQVDRIRDDNIIANTFFSIANDVVRIKQLTSDSQIEFSIDAVNERSRATEMETQAAFSFDVVVETTKQFEISLTSDFTQSLTIGVIRNVESSVQSQANIASNVDRIRGFQITTDSEFTQTADFRVVRDAHLTAFDAVAMTIDPVVIYSAESQQTAVHSLAFNGGRLNVTQASLTSVSRLLAACDRGVIMRTVVGLSSVGPFSNWQGSPSDSIVDNSLYITKTINSASRTAGIISAGTIPNLLTINECWDDRDYVGEDDFSIRFKFRPTTSGFHQDFIWAGRRDIAYWSFSWGTFRTRAFTFTSFDESRTVNSTFNYTMAQSLPTTIIDTWIDVEFKGVRSNTLGGTQRRAYFIVNGAEHWVTSVFASNGNITDHLWGADLSSPETRLLLQARTFNSPIFLDDLEINIKQNQIGNVYSNAFRKIYLPFTGNYYDWNSAVTQTASASIVSTNTISAKLTGLSNGNASISSTASVQAIIGKLDEIESSLFNDAAIVCAATRIQQLVSDGFSNSSLDAINDRLRNAQGNLVVESASNVVNDRIRNHNAAIESNSDTSVVNDRIRDYASDITATAEVNAVIGTLESIFLNAFSDGELQTVISKTAGFDSNLETSVEITAALNYIFSVSSNIETNSSVSIPGERILQASIATESIASTLAVGEEFSSVTSNISSSFITEQYYIEDNYVDNGYFEVLGIRAVAVFAGNSNLQSEFNLTVSVRTDVFVAISVDSSADITADVVKTTENTVLQVSESTTVINAVKSVEANSHIVSDFTVFANGVTSNEINAVLFNDAALTVTAEATKPFDIALSAEFTQNANTFDSLNTSFESYQTAEFNQTTQGDAIRDAVIATESIASQLSVAVKEAVSEILCETRFDITVDAVKVTDITSSNDATFAISILAVKVTDSLVTATSQAVISVDADAVKDAVIATESIASQLSAVARVAAFFINADVQATVTADISVQRSAAVTTDSKFTQSTFGGAVRFADSDIETTATINAAAGIIKPFEATIASAMAFVAQVREIRIDVIVYIIPAEGWEYRITGESRDYSIIGESNLRRIAAETRLRRINGESRIHIIE